MKPRHAELLAGDLDRETLIRYVDRFLMFYVRTADRLQRTSTWRDNLEGGLDYLKSVVIDDKLGIGAELEAEMQHVVDTYEDEWKRPSPTRDAQALPPLRQQRPARRQPRVSGGARPDSPGHAGGTNLQRSRLSHIPVVAVPAKA
jgi:nitrite reductase (NADH) large subunit